MGEPELQDKRAGDLHGGEHGGPQVLVAYSEADDDRGDGRRHARADEVERLALEFEQSRGRPQVHNHQRHRDERDDDGRRDDDDAPRSLLPHHKEHGGNDEGEHDEEAEQSETEFHTGSSLPFSSARRDGIYPPRPGEILKIFALP